MDQVRLVIIGESTVGKTSLVGRVAHDKYDPSHDLTVGMDLARFMIGLDDEKIIDVEIWDCAGQERFHSITSYYYRNADAILVTFSVNDPLSFNNIPKWLNEVQVARDDGVQIYLLGLKNDLDTLVPYDDILNLVEKEGIIYLQASAKTGEGVRETFKEVVLNIIHSRTTRRILVEEERVALTRNERRTRCCC
jgi:small GTP-binding protein